TEAVVQRSLETTRAHVADLRVRFEQGLIPPNDVLSAEAEESRRRMLVIEAANTTRIAEADLARLLGQDDGARLEPSAALTAPDVPAAGGPPVRPERAALERRVEA